MKKTTKLLSVILAFVMALSCMTMMASAARTKYKEVTDLENLSAYSPYYTVTRLTTEERASILFDSIDQLLTGLNIRMDEINIIGLIKITLDFTCIDRVLDSLDSFYKYKGLLGIIGGTIGKLNLDSWQKDMTRDDNAQLQIANEILELLSTNTNAIGSIFTDGLSLGLVGSFIKNVNLAPINNAVKDLPGLIKALVFPLMGRQDDDATQRETLGNKKSDLLKVAQDFVNGLFTKPMNWTSYREDAAGNDLGFTLPLPFTAEGTSRYFVKNADGTIDQYDYAYAGALGSPKAGFGKTPTVTYTKTKEFDTEDCTTYVYRAPEGYGGDATLKWYKAGDPSGIDADNPDTVVDANGRVQSSYWLPTVAKAFIDGSLKLDINGTDSVLGLVYKFAPYLFREMAPTVLNGSAKMRIAEAFDVKFTEIGLQGEDAVTKEVENLTAALAKEGKELTNEERLFFTKAQEYYTWEYSDYKVINGVPYYRYQNQYSKGEIPKNISAYYYMFNWDWTIEDNFMDEFIPTTVGSTWALDGLNNLVKKAIDTMILPSWEVKGKTYNRSEVFAWTEGDNSNLLNNLKVCAREFFKIAPEEIVDEYYAEAQFYDAMMNDDKNKTADENLHRAVNGLVCELVKLIMPQIKFADNIIDQPITAIAAVVVRELCTQLMPTYNFDAMIYANYGNASNNVRALADHTADEWLDITLYMGVNLGMYYLRNIADVGEDDNKGYYSVMSDLGALPALSNRNTIAAGDKITFTAGSYKMADGTASWLAAVDWIVDWALDVNTEWCWHFGRLIDAGTVDLTTYQNPFNKINSVILSIIPDLETLLNISAFDGTDYGSGTFLEKILKDGLVDSIVNLDVPSLLSLFKLTTDSVLRKNNIADTLVNIVINILNKITLKVCGGANLIKTNTINSVATLLNQTNIKDVVVTLIGKLYAASNTYNLFDPVFPILNFFVGWTTDPQKYAEPNLFVSNSGGDTYLSSANSNSINVQNTSSGMLLKHRNSDTKDKHYIVTVTGVDFGDSGITTSTAFPFDVAPGESKPIDMTVPSVAKVAKITVTYNFTGKDGKKIGGDMTKIMYAYISNISDDEGGSGRYSGDDDDGYNGIADYSRNVFTTDIYNAITEYKATTYGVPSTGGSILAMRFDSFNTNKAPEGLGGTYFAHLTTNEAGTVGEWPTAETTDTSISGKTYKAKAGTTEETFSEENSKANNLYGLYDMGVLYIKSRAKNKTMKVGIFGGDESWHTSGDLALEVDFYYYNDFGIDNEVNKYVGYQLKADQYDATAFNNYETALKKVVELAQYPMKTDYTTTIQPQIPGAIDALEAAYKALMGASKPADTDLSTLQTTLDGIETNPDRDLNFQDYALFEYFQYEKQRTAAREMLKATTPPAAPEKYVDSVWGNDLVNAIVAAQAPASDASDAEKTKATNVTAGINATIVEPTPKEMSDWETAVKNYRPAYYTPLQVDDQAAKLTYYAEFMQANPKLIDKTFLNQEITYAEAQNYAEADYSADSWARYTKALADAKDAAANNNKESELFDAKYELMVAQNKLQKKDRSMKEVGYMNEELIPLIQHANAILENFGQANSLYAVKADAGLSNDEALAQLVKALGVKYNVTVDEKEHEGILYDRSALTFQEYDRTATAKNKKAVDGAADKLRAAIENFECTAKVESNNTITTVDQDVRFIQGIAPNSLKNVDDLIAKLNISENATPIYTASKAGQYGTGARVELKASADPNAALLATYFVVIYGDVNGDGAVDALDALEVDYAYHTSYYMGDVYDDAADIDDSGIVDDADYAAIRDSVYCVTPINQNPTH